MNETTTETTPTPKDLIKRWGITMTAIQLAKRPDRDVSDWGQYAGHFQITIQVGKLGPCITCVYSQGSAHRVYEGRKGYSHRPPSVIDVLASLVSDASGADEAFEDWADSLGFDTDSRSAEKTHRECQRIRAELIACFGADGFAALQATFQGY